jgi:cobalamin biosynthesis protein CobW
MQAKIPATIVTGFLGAGKTTLIRHMLENAKGRRIALIINEFGDLGVDGDILKGCGDETCSEDDIMELSNGCICCTVADDFIPTMEKLLAKPARSHRDRDKRSCASATAGAGVQLARNPHQSNR